MPLNCCRTSPFASACMAGIASLLGALSMAATPVSAAEDGQAPLLVSEERSRQPVIAVPPARPASPTIDGHVKYDEWFYAASVTAFYDAQTGGLPPHPVRMYLCYDDQALYVGLVIHRDPLHPTPKATFDAGPHDHIWWKDDNFELIIEPGDPAADLLFGYAFAGNSIGGWSDLRYAYAGAEGGAGASWEGDWEYQASRAGRDSWHAELRIPYDQFEDAEKPAPGAAWFMNMAVQQVTPQRRLIDWSHMWSFGQTGYESVNKARLVFVGPDDPIIRSSDVGRVRTDPQDPPLIGLRSVFYHQGQTPYTVACQAQLYRVTGEGEDREMLGFMDLWDRLLKVRATGEPIADPNDPTSFDSADEIQRTINQRYELVTAATAERAVEPEKAGYFPLEAPREVGDYVLAYEFSDAATGQLLASQMVPFQVLPRFDLTLTPHFLEHQTLQVDVRTVDAPEAAERVALRLEVEGETITDTTAALTELAGGELQMALATNNWPEDTTGTVKAELLNAAGEVLDTASTELHRPATPDWFGQNVGRSQVVPPPFEPVRSEAADTAAIWQRTYRFGDRGLPTSIISRGTELLARPMTLDLEAGDLTEADLKASLERTETTPRDVSFVSTQTGGDVKLTTRAKVHYDGAIRFDLELDPAKPVTVDRLVLEIPIDQQWADLFTHNGTWTDFSRASKDGLGGGLETWFETYPDGAMPFTYAFFLGSYDRGVQWFCPSDRGWSNADEQRKIALVRSEGEVTLRVAFVDEPVTLNEPLRLNFGLTVTPIKPVERGRDLTFVAFGKPPQLRETGLEQFDENLPMYRQRGGDVITSYLSDGAQHFGQPWIYNPEDATFMEQFAALVEKHGMRYRPYSGWGVHTNIPHFETFGKEMLKQPLRNSGWGSYWHNPRSAAWADWWLGGAKDLGKNLGFDGIYLDSTAYPELSANKLDGMAWTDEQGAAHGVWPVWALRDFLERLYVLFHHELRTDGLVDLHDGREPLYFINAFADATLSGEDHLQRGRTILEVFSPKEFAAYYMSHLNGDARRFIWWNWMDLPIARNEMRSMLLLHDVPMVVGGGIVKYHGDDIGYGIDTRPWVRLRALREHYVDATFVPYWKPPAIISAQPEGLMASAWVDRAEGRAMVVLSNLTTEPWEGEVRFDLDRLGVNADAPIVDAMFNAPLNRKASEPLPIAIEPQRYRLLLFNDRLSLPESSDLDGTQETLPVR